MVAINLAPYEPDKQRFNAGASASAINVVPLPDGGYGPLPSTVSTTALIEPLGNFNSTTDILGNFNSTTDELVTGPGGALIFGSIQLPGACTGMFAARRADGTEALFAATAISIYIFDRVSFVFVDISGSSAPYAGTSRWSFAQFGSYILAQNGVDPEQLYNLETDLVFSDNTSAPICKYIATIGGFVFRGNIVSWASQGITVAPAMIQCSALEDPTDNEPQNDNWSDYQSIPIGDEVMGIVPVTGGAHIWLRNAHYAMNLILSGDYTFSLTPINTIRGTSAPWSIGIAGQDDYTLYTDEGWLRYSGAGQTPIGDGRVNATFLTICDQDERENILAMPDPEHNIIWNAYTDVNATRQMLGYHYLRNEWTTSDLAVAASCRSRTFAYSDSDPPIVDGDLLRFAIIDTDGILGYLVGNNRAATVSTNEIQFALNRSFVNDLLLNSDADNFTITVATTDVKGGAFRTRAPASPSARSGHVPVRADGRTHKFTVNIAAEEMWTNATGIEVSVTQAGRS